MKRRHTLRALFAGALLLLLNCGSPETRVVAREPADAGPAEPRTRGRVRVVGGVLVSDRGTPLRGVTMPLDIDADFAFDAALLDEVASSAGLNTVHTYAENWQHVTGEREAALDRLVDLADAAGLYVIVAIGGGPGGDGHPGNGWFDIEKVRSFWSHYGPRYANRTHVLYEIQNNPQLGCDTLFEPATLEMEREIFTLIRQVAPQTHVLLFSFEAVPTAGLLTASVDAVAGVADFANASIAFHATADCVPPEEFAAVRQAASAIDVPQFATELDTMDFTPYARALEANGVGWTSHSYLTRSRDLAMFRELNTAAGITWCPDFGTWPEDAEQCAP